MKIQPTQWSEPKQRDLMDQLTGYWIQDKWPFGDCPIQDGCQYYSSGKTIYFICQSAFLKGEMKYACWQKLVKQEWKTKTLWSKARDIKLIGDWLNTIDCGLASLVQQDLTALETSFRSYLVNGGFWKGYTQSKLDSHQERQEYHWSGEMNTLRQIYKLLQGLYDDRNEYDKEIWDVRKLGYKGNPTKSSYTLNFSSIRQGWLLQAAKSFIKYSLPIFSLSECQARLGVLRNFSEFLQQFYFCIKPSNVNRSLTRNYISHLAECGLGENARLNTLVRLRGFLELCAREDWANIPNTRLIYREDFPRLPKRKPRFIPGDVFSQLHTNLDGLSDHIKRMVLIIQEVGMRISELCRMPFDCLIQDAQGDFFLRYYQYKMKKEHTVPISRDIVAVTQEQQHIVREQYGSHVYLFPSPNIGHKGEPTKHQNFSRAINKLAVERNIRDSNGQLWHFQAHQFRHTVGTRMINLGVPQHIIQKYLGHETPEMTSVYAHIHDQTLKEEFTKFKRKIVNVLGEVVQSENILAEIAFGAESSNLDEQWLKRNILAQALPNGICALPIVQKRCPYGANRCLTGVDGKGCGHFKTDNRYLPQHQEHLERTGKIIQWAEENSQSRRSQEILKENLPIKENLERIIEALEESTDETPT